MTTGWHLSPFHCKDFSEGLLGIFLFRPASVWPQQLRLSLEKTLLPGLEAWVERSSISDNL